MGQGEAGEEWDFHRIGTAAEKTSVEKELAELRERLAKVEEWKRRRQDIEEELNRVWTEGGDELSPPSYLEAEQSIAEKSQPEDSNILGDSEASLLSKVSSEAA